MRGTRMNGNITFDRLESTNLQERSASSARMRRKCNARCVRVAFTFSGLDEGLSGYLSD